MLEPNALLVVAKQPKAGRTKTRLVPPLNYAQAAELYECFLQDTLAVMRQVPGVRRRIGFLPAGAEAYFDRLAPDLERTSQHGQTLGERLDHLLAEAFREGAQSAVVMDSDSPTLPAGHVAQAFERLRGADVVLGPTRDGGYYLIGMNRPQPSLLRQVQMSTPRVLEDTLTVALAAGLAVSLLPTWYDVDTIADLRLLDDELRRSNGNGNAAATRQWLERTDWRHLDP